MSVTSSFDESTRDLDISITANVLTEMNGDYRLAAIVLESGITGPPPEYNQGNEYSGGPPGSMGGFEALPSDVPANIMVYDHVPRHLAGGYDGSPGSLPSGTIPVGDHSHSFEWNVPIGFNEDRIYVVGVIINNTTGEIVNAGKGLYIQGFANAAPFWHSMPTTEGFVDSEYTYDLVTHDPDLDGLSIVEVLSLPTWLSLTDNGDGFGELSGTPTQEGTYPVSLEVSDGTHQVLQEFEITVSAPLQEDWIQVGEVDFTSQSADFVKIELDNQDRPYVCVGFDNSTTRVYRLESGAWEVLPGSIPNSSFSMDFALAPDNTAYVIVGNQVYDHDGSAWNALASISGQNGLTIDVNDAGTVYASSFVAGPGVPGEGFELDGSSLQSLGLISDGAAVWHRMTIGQDGLPLIIYGTDGQNIAYSEVVKWNGTSWDLLGGDYVEPNSQTYFEHDVAVSAAGEVYVSAVLGLSQLMSVYTLDNGSWVNIGTNITSGATYDHDLEINAEGYPIIAFDDEASMSRTSVMEYDGSTWSYVGQPEFTPNADGQSLAMSSTGEPFVAYKASGSGLVSVKRFGQVVGLNEVDSNSPLKVYPNPSNGQFNLHTEVAGEYRVLDGMGKLVAQGRISASGQAQSIDLSELSSGLYHLMFRTSEASYSSLLQKL